MQTKAEEQIQAMPKVEVVPAIEQLNRAEIDVQIATAKQYPRNLERSLSMIERLACQDHEIAASCIFKKPAGYENGVQKFVEGPSVRLAEILATQWGNLRCETQIIEVSETDITARGVCMDLETNVAISMPIQRGITYSSKGKNKGKRYSNDMIQTTCNAACSTAYRNAVFKIIPQVFWKSILDKIKKVAVGSADTFEERLDKMFLKFSEFGVSVDQITECVDKKNIKELTPEDLLTLSGLYNAIKEGDLSVPEAFPKKSKKPNPSNEKDAPSMFANAGGEK